MKNFFFILPLDEQFVHSLVSLPGFRRNNSLPMILSASALNFCMIEFSIPDFNATIIKVVKLYSVRNGSSVSTLVNEGRGYRCSCTLLYISWPRREHVPLSLYFISIFWRFLWLLFMTAFHRHSVKVHGFAGVKVRLFYSCYYYYTVVLHWIIFPMPNRSRKPPFSM